jgi:hypothetical protein
MAYVYSDFHENFIMQEKGIPWTFMSVFTRPVANCSRPLLKDNSFSTQQGLRCVQQTVPIWVIPRRNITQAIRQELFVTQ